MEKSFGNKKFYKWQLHKINIKTKYFCIINADGSMDPKYLKQMRETCKDLDFVFGSRYQKPGGGSEDDDFVTSIGNYVFTLSGNILFNLKITDILYTYILFFGSNMFLYF